ncbi:MAG: hypothetical protein WBR15_02135 [Gammaproteobacteria bacterium]
MIIYQPLTANIHQFVEFWSPRYRYPEENLYEENIGRELTQRRILDLYRWKNGTRLSARKRDSVLHNFVRRRRELAHLELTEYVNVLLRDIFTDGGAIWRIFWLHCWQSLRFPIYDQHVHRAMTFIQTGVAMEISNYDPRTINSYITSYMPFHATFAGIDGRDVDKALWAFGKFIKVSNFLAIAQNDKVAEFG